MGLGIAGHAKGIFDFVNVAVFTGEKLVELAMAGEGFCVQDRVEGRSSRSNSHGGRPGSVVACRGTEDSGRESAAGVDWL